MMFRPQYRGLLASLACLGLVAAAAPAVPLFDFEDQGATSLSRRNAAPSSALTSLTMAKDGVSVTLTRDGGRPFNVVSGFGSQSEKPATWGQRSLDPRFSGNPGDALVCTFGVPVNSASIEFGDFGSNANTFFMQAFDGPDGSGNVVGANSVSYGASAFATFGTGNVTAPGIRSIRFFGGDSGTTHSIFYDNIRVDNVAGTGDAIPEAGSMSLLAGVLPLLGFLRRRTR